MLHDPPFRWRRLKYGSFLGLLAVLLLLLGCEKKEQRLPAANIHGITREFAAAASSAAPSMAEIRSELRASDDRPGAPDQLYITVRGGNAATFWPQILARMQQGFAAVATRHGLTQQRSVESRSLLRLNYRHAGSVTHSIQISSWTATGSPEPPRRGDASAARLAIILDDLGSDRSVAEMIFAMPYPLTLSVLPGHPHSAEIAEDADRRGYQVMLHLPMQSVADEKAEAVELRPGLTMGEVKSRVEGMLASIPHIVGVNNHQGSQATADAQLMSELMPVLREEDLFYVDSRTTAATVAYDTAQHFGVRSAFRSTPFLDDVAEVAAVRAQIRAAARAARAKGEAIAIGHAHPATLAALREALPQLQSQGVQLVFVSELVH